MDARCGDVAIVASVDLFLLMGFHEAFRCGVVVGLPPPERSVRGDLVVVLAVREDCELAQVWGEPRCRVRHMDETVLDLRGLRVHAHHLVGLRLIAGDRVAALMDQLLDQLGPRGLVLDQHDSGAKPVVLLAHRALQLRVFHCL